MTVLSELISRTATNYADGTALEWRDRSLTYKEFQGAARDTARDFEHHGIQSGDRLALVSGREPEVYVAYAAGLELACPIVPLGASQPAERLQAQAAIAGVRAVIGSRESAHIAKSLASSADCQAIILDVGQRATCNGVTNVAGKQRLRQADSLAYILFTSGSTGTPKGVRITYDAVHWYLSRAHSRYNFGPTDRLSQNFDLTFDLSVFDMFCAWGSGATLVIPDDEDKRNVVRYVEGRGLTSWLHVPTAIVQALHRGELDARALPSLRWSLFCGEALPQANAETWARAAYRSTVENLYGPTELTVSCAAFRLPVSIGRWPMTRNGSVPIGEIHDGHDFLVVGEHGLSATRGELCVRGPQRFVGYLDDKDDKGRFLDAHGRALDEIHHEMPPSSYYYRTGDYVEKTRDGLVFLGRRDSQIKLGGYRVELGEIEAAAMRCPGMLGVAVTAVGDDELLSLSLFYVSSELEPAVLRRYLFSVLPRYMVPRRLHVVDALPLTVSGKVDRQALTRRALAEIE